MSVEIDPQELGFHRPFTVEVQEVLRIRNPNPHPVAFKVKTTAPKQYCVRPNSGRVEPGKEVEVAVILQAMKQEPPPDTKCRDKFLVQSVAITGDKEFSNLAAIWDNIEKSAVQEKKIRVIFMNPAPNAFSTPSKPTPANGAEMTPDVAPPAYSSPGEFANAPAEPKSSMDTKDTRDEEPSGMAGVAAAATAQYSDQSPEQLKRQLLEAERMISQLKQDQGGLRQRKGGSSDEKSSSAPTEVAQAVRGTEGVPIKIAAVLCLVSFLLAYFFF
ncbi:VAMP-associated protein [Xylariomycetidae sp. FL0641]|nr:VAMP-associated protein [Xylariomycetidae sp. FL0641]